MLKAIRLLPAEHSLFVVREVDIPNASPNHCPMYSFEKFKIFPAGPNKINQMQEPDAWMMMYNTGHLSHVHIADPIIPPQDDNSILGKLRGNMDDPPLPHPLTIYGRCVNEEGFVLVRFFAQGIMDEITSTSIQQQHLPLRRRLTYHYPLEFHDWFGMRSHLNQNVRILPGVVRPLLVYTPWDDITDAPPILDIQPWVDRGMQLPYGIDHENVVAPLLGRGRQAVFANAPWKGLRAAALAWDETIGRLVISRADGSGLIVYDFAHAPRHGALSYLTIDIRRELIFMYHPDDEGRRFPLPLNDIPNPDVFYRSNDDVLSMMEDS
ncbi:hypothetical protein C2E23DRAFT_418830 [Lenzites betulinus]|nr:hypothetical protein C2E23DRAFT_418830 [Lenzites betulinus]